MIKRSFFIEQKYYFFLFLLILSSSIFSIFFLQYVYDGHHHGLMYSNAIDLLNGKLPFKQIFIQYGLLSTIFHSLSLFLFGKQIFSLHIITTLFYSLSIFFIFQIIKKIVDEKYALLGVFVLLSQHAIPALPWPNYISYFFITASVLSFINDQKYSSLIAGIFLSFSVLARHDYFIPIFFTLIIYILAYFISTKSITKPKNLFNLLIGFSLPFFIFILYLLYANIFNDWARYLLLPNFYLEYNNISTISLIYNFVFFFLSKSFINFINSPQHLLVSIILIFNTLLLARFFIDKNFKLLFIAILTLCLSAIGLSTELFRLYTSVSLGVIILVYFISQIKSNDYRKFLVFLIVIISLFSLTFYPSGNYINFNKTKIIKDFEIPVSKIFTFNKFSRQQVSVLDKIYNLRNQLLINCNIKYGENLTFDTYFANILNLQGVRLMPYMKSDAKNSEMYKFYDSGFVDKINKLLKEDNIILLITENNDIFDEGSIIFDYNYDYQAINLNPADDKPFELKFYYPKKCLIKS